ncbi:MAG: PEGA domain-containing protein [Patescibacteria group bacterium]
MQLKYRRVIYIFFIVIFAISSLWLILYTQGYEYNQYKQKIEKTGALDIKSKPANASVNFNGNYQEKTTPTILRRLPPDTYDLTVTVPGWQTWQKKLIVKGGSVTATGMINLWPAKQVGNKLADTENINTKLSPNRVNLVYLKEHGLASGLWLLNLTSGVSALLNREAINTIEYIEWSFTNKNLLTNVPASPQPWQVINLTDNTKKTVDIPNQVKSPIVHWSSNNDNTLYISTGTEMHELSLTSGITKLLWRAQIINFKHHAGLIYALVKEGKTGMSLKILNPKNLQEIPLAEPVAISTDFKFLETNDEWLPLLDTVRHSLYLLRSPLTASEPTINLPDVVNISWSADGSKLLLHNNYEIWSYELKKNKLDLIYRISTPITTAVWFNDNYILLTLDNELQALELDTRDQQQKWIISTQTKPIQDLFLDPLGSVITVKTEQGLFRLPLTKALPPADERLTD